MFSSSFTLNKDVLIVVLWFTEPPGRGAPGDQGVSVRHLSEELQSPGQSQEPSPDSRRGNISSPYLAHYLLLRYRASKGIHVKPLVQIYIT